MRRNHIKVILSVLFVASIALRVHAQENDDFFVEPLDEPVPDIEPPPPPPPPDPMPDEGGFVPPEGYEVPPPPPIPGGDMGVWGGPEDGETAPMGGGAGAAGTPEGPVVFRKSGEKLLRPDEDVHREKKQVMRLKQKFQRKYK